LVALGNRCNFLLKAIACFSLWMAPFQLAVGPNCSVSDGDERRRAVAWTGVLLAHFVGSCVYHVLALFARWLEMAARDQREKLAFQDVMTPKAVQVMAPTMVRSTSGNWKREVTESIAESGRPPSELNHSSRDEDEDGKRAPSMHIEPVHSSLSAELATEAICDSLESDQVRHHDGKLRHWWVKTGLLVDTFALLGAVGEIRHLFRTENQPVPVWEQWLWLLIMLRAWRFKEPPQHTEPSRWAFLFEVGKLLGALAYFAHIGACTFVLTATMELHDSMAVKTWADHLVKGESADTVNCGDVYMSALYFASYTLTGVGYGDVTPGNTLEQAISVAYMMLGQVCVAKIFADLNWLTATYSFWQARHYEQVTQVCVALESLGVPFITKQRALAYLDYINEEQKQRRAQEVIKDLSMPLREELNIIVYHSLVLAAPFLNSQSVPVIRNLVMKLTDAVYLPCDMIIRRGDVGEELFFIRDGRVDVFANVTPPAWDDTPLCVFKKGHYFGEVAFLTGAKRTSWVMARTFTVCATLAIPAMEQVMESYPGAVSKMVGSLSQTCKIEPGIKMEQAVSRISEYFENDEKALTFSLFSNSAGNGNEVDWNCFRSLLRLVGVGELDQKLLWCQVDKAGEGSVTLIDFLKLLRKHGAGTQPSSSRMNMQSMQSVNTAPSSKVQSDLARRWSLSEVNIPSTAAAPGARRSVEAPQQDVSELSAQIRSLQGEVTRMASQLEMLVWELPKLAAPYSSHGVHEVEEC